MPYQVVDEQTDRVWYAGTYDECVRYWRRMSGRRQDRTQVLCVETNRYVSIG